MRIRFIMVGKTKQEWVKPACVEYLKRCQRYFKCEELVLNEGKGSPEQVRSQEANSIIQACKDCAYVFALDEIGKEFTSEAFSNLFKRVYEDGHTTIAFVIGGAYGLDESVRKRSSQVIALSKMTFPHQFVRAILYEQVYRAITIMRGEPYHH